MACFPLDLEGCLDQHPSFLLIKMEMEVLNMRLWHYKLIPVLPRQQLLGQWRECCLIAKNIAEKGSPNHILVNPVMDYDVEEFTGYCKLVVDEMTRRGYKSDIFDIFRKLNMCVPMSYSMHIADDHQFFPGWHNDQYLRQCLSNLQEKHDRGGITDNEWEAIIDSFSHI